MSEPLALTLVGLIAFGAAAFVVQPLLRRPRQGKHELHGERSPRLGLLERRDRALAALSELEFDHRTGTIGDADYHRLLGPLRREAAETLHLLDTARQGAAGAARSAKKRGRAVPQAVERAR